MRFLLVEKDQNYADRLAAMIRACCPPGVDIDLTHTAEGAQALIRSRYYDVCFLEYELEEPSTGLDVLRAHNPSSMLTAFVVLTGHASKEVAFEALMLGAMDYLIKERFTEFELAKCVSYSMYLKRREITYQVEALKDSLTGLGNKGLFEAQLEQAAKRAERDHERLGLLIIDLDGFKAINDKYGHKVGDGILRQVAERIVNETRSSDVIARIGGDEFAAILIKPQSPDHIHAIAQKIEKAIVSAPYNVSGTVLKVGASVGSAVFPDDSADVHTLFTAADKSMYKQKNVKRVALRKSRDYMEAVLH